MVTIMTYVALVIFGLVFGSFAGATVWRLRAHQLKQERKAGEKVDQKEYKQLERLLGHDMAHDRSRCLHCGYVLRWYDLIPLVSWLSLRGKCRHCHQSIGYFEPLVEVGMTAYFVLSFIFWPHLLSTPLAIAQFIIWLVIGIGFAIQFAYDLKWSLLDSRISYGIIGLGLVSAVLSVLQTSSPWAAIVSVFWSVFIFGGIYLIVWLISRGKWIGDGDVALGFGLGLLLANWQLSFLGLFLANFIGCLVVIPLLARKRVTTNSRIPFGPLLILGAILAQLFGTPLLNAYLNLL